MSEGPEVRRTADRIAEVLVGRRIEWMELRRRMPLDPEIERRVVGSTVCAVRTHGKHLVIAFSGGVFLHNHMMMWGKWRVYSRKSFDAGRAKPPPRVQWRRNAAPSSRVGATVTDVRADSRVRLVLATADHVAIEFNGPLLQFGTADPARSHASMQRLGPDALARRFAVGAARTRLHERARKCLADVLLDQSFVAGIGNKYKSEILFVRRLHPFQPAGALSPAAERALLTTIPKVLKGGYTDAGRTRPLGADEAANRWDLKHYVFRRGGRPCWRCGTRILTDRTQSARVTYWCPTCQPAPAVPCKKRRAAPVGTAPAAARERSRPASRERPRPRSVTLTPDG